MLKNFIVNFLKTLVFVFPFFLFLSFRAAPVPPLVFRELPLVFGLSFGISTIVGTLSLMQGCPPSQSDSEPASTTRMENRTRIIFYVLLGLTVLWIFVSLQTGILFLPKDWFVNGLKRASIF